MIVASTIVAPLSFNPRSANRPLTRSKIARPRAKDFTHERAQRNAPLTDAQKAKNRSKSAVRAHVEHPFFAHLATMGLRQDPLPGTGQER